LPTVANPVAAPDDKALLLLDPATIERELPLRAILVPRVGTGGDHRVSAIRSAQALTALAPSTIVQLTGSGGPHLLVMRQLCQSLPTYALDLGPDLTSIPAVIASVLDG
jgi:hypothetical protein